MQTSAQLIRRAGPDGSLATDRTISESVRKWASQRGDDLAFVGPDSTLTWRDLDADPNPDPHRDACADRNSDANVAGAAGDGQAHRSADAGDRRAPARNAGRGW